MIAALVTAVKASLKTICNQDQRLCSSIPMVQIQ